MVLDHLYVPSCHEGLVAPSVHHYLGLHLPLPLHVAPHDDAVLDNLQLVRPKAVFLLRFRQTTKRAHPSLFVEIQFLSFFLIPLVKKKRKTKKIFSETKKKDASFLNSIFVFYFGCRTCIFVNNSHHFFSPATMVTV